MNELKQLKVTAFLSGAAVMVVEILGSRLFAPYFGSSTYVWSALIGVILASLSLGYYTGGRMADARSSKEDLSVVLFIAGVVVFLIPVLTPSIAVISIAFGYRLGPLLLALILFSGPNILLGMVPPYAIKLAAKTVKTVGSVSGDLYALSTVGSILGTLLTGFVLIPVLPITGIFVGVAASLFLTSFLLGGPSKEVILSSVAFLLVSFISFRAAGADAVYRGEEVVYDAYTPYHRILVLDNPEKTVRLMILDASYSGGMNLSTHASAFDYPDYFETPFLLHANISSVYMIGEGTGVGAVQVKTSHPEASLLVTEIDPQVHAAAVKYFNVTEGDGFAVKIGDGRQILKQSPELYDLVIIDAFNSVFSIPTHLTTVEFFHDVKTHLKPDGIAEINVISSLNEDSMFLQSLCKTIGAEFGHVYFYPVTSTVNKSLTQNVILIASNQSLPTPGKEYIHEHSGGLFSEAKLEDMLGHRIEWFNCSDGILLTDDYSPTDYLMEPLLERTFA
jgi:spermidine synthase